MAEIKIEKDKNNNSSPIWPWILGLLLLVGVVWAIAEMTGSDDQDRRDVAAVEQQDRQQQQTVTTDRMADRPADNARASEAFIAYVNETDAEDESSLSHTATAQGLERLANALEELSGQDNAYNQQINEIRQNAEQIQTDPESLQHANLVHSAFMSAADVFEQLRQNRFPDADSEVEDVREQADQINPDEQLLDQKDEVDSFFEKAADAVERMKDDRSDNNRN